MKTIIAGGRHYNLTDEDREFLDSLTITEVVSGVAPGADLDGVSYAIARNLPIEQFPADWRRYGKRAGFIRNREMAKYAEACVLFPGGRGTASMAREAAKEGLTVHDRRKP